MAFTIALAQCTHPENNDVLSLAADFAQQAAAAGADLLAFPEAFQMGPAADKETWLAAAEPLDGPFCCAMNKIADEHSLWMVYTIAEKNPCKETASASKGAAPLPFNTAVVTDSHGTIQGSYRKIHLFDSATTCESSRMSAGNALFTPIQTPFCTLGLGICYDLRFPELTRAAAEAGADLIVFPAAWVDGSQKAEQWQTLLTARALENELFVAGVCTADAGCIGRSCIAGPDGQVVAVADDTNQLLTATIDHNAIATMRQKIPVWAHRRTDLY